MEGPVRVNIKTGSHRITFGQYQLCCTDDAGDAALRYESPLWLAIATGNPNHRQSRSPVIDMTKIKRPDSEGKEREDATHTLQAAMAEINRDTDVLHITGEVPKSDQWEALGQHFTKVRFLKVATGRGEEWIDAKFPLNWPLELLIIADAASDRITTPAILEGRINHLVLLFACGLRFEGPLTKDLMKNARPIKIVPRGTEPELLPFDVETYSVPEEWSQWFNNKYKEGGVTFSLEHSDDPSSCIKSLDILGNNALEMLTYVALAKFYLLGSLENLTIYSENTDLSFAPYLFLNFLTKLMRLKHVKLTLESATYAKILKSVHPYPFIHLIHPASLETLRLRGPVSAVFEMGAFAADLADPDFLPNLKRISLVLDLPDASSEHPEEASPEQLRAAHVACEKVFDVAAARGVVVEPFEEPWAEIYPTLFRAVNHRWPSLTRT